MAAPSCSFSTQIPNPPTTVTSCAVPIGGSNSTILDTCCNGHINVLRTYSAPNAKDNCYQFCTTDAVDDVENCLTQNLGPYLQEKQVFQCFNAVSGKTAEGASARIRMGKGMVVVIGLGLLGAVMGAS